MGGGVRQPRAELTSIPALPHARMCPLPLPFPLPSVGAYLGLPPFFPRALLTDHDGERSSLSRTAGAPTDLPSASAPH